jgi:Subtilase family
MTLTATTTVAAPAAILALLLGPTPAPADDVPASHRAGHRHARRIPDPGTHPGRTRVTCVIDTGVNGNPDNDASVIGRQSVYPGDGSDGDPDAHHGTYLAMNIAAPANGWGMIGIAPQTRILSIRAIDNGAHNFLSSAYEQGLDRCWQARATGGVNVETAVLALGHPDTDTTANGQAVQNEIDFVRAHGISVVAAAGNDGGGVQWPARYGPAFAVGASDANGGFCDSASRGSALDLSALGCGDDSALWDTGASATIDGSSTSAGLVAGVLTALRAYKPELTPDQAEQLLVSNADSTGAGQVINAAAAFRAAGLAAMVDAYHPATPAPPPTPGTITVGTVCPDGGVLSCQKPKLAAAHRNHRKVTLTVATLPSGAFYKPASSAAGTPRPARRSRQSQALETDPAALRVDRRRALPNPHRPPAHAAQTHAEQAPPAPLTCSHPRNRCGEAPSS